MRALLWCDARRGSAVEGYFPKSTHLGDMVLNARLVAHYQALSRSGGGTHEQRRDAKDAGRWRHGMRRTNAELVPVGYRFCSRNEFACCCVSKGVSLGRGGFFVDSIFRISILRKNSSVGIFATIF